MPFVNDVIATNQEKVAESKQKNCAPRVSRYLFDPDAILQQLRQKIVGQESVLASLGDLLHCVKADITDRSRPLAVCFLVGPTGVGKTETVKLISQAITGQANKLCRIDMNTLAQEHYAASLTGAPPGYTGSKEGHTLFNEELIKGSYSQPGVVLFDEIEKANDVVKRALLNVMDSGFLQLTAGTKQIDFTNAILFFTSNLGAKKAQSYQQQFHLGWRSWLGLQARSQATNHIIQLAIKQHFDPEFINRIDYMLIYEAMTREQLPQLFDIELLKINQRLQKKGITITVSPSAKHFLLAEYDDQYGARHFIRRLKTQLEPKLAKAINQQTHTNQFSVQFINGLLSVEPIVQKGE